MTGLLSSWKWCTALPTKKSCCSGKIQNVLKIPNSSRFRMKFTRFRPISDANGSISRGFEPILAENTQHWGVKSKNKFRFITHPFHIMAPTLEGSSTGHENRRVWVLAIFIVRYSTISKNFFTRTQKLKVVFKKSGFGFYAKNAVPCKCRIIKKFFERVSSIFVFPLASANRKTRKF